MERRLSVVFFLLAVLISISKCYGQGVEVACPPSTSVMNPNGATVNNSTGGSKQWLCVSNVNGNVSTTSAFSGAAGSVGAAGVVQASNGAGAFQTTAMTDNGTAVINTEPFRAPLNSCGSPGLSFTGASTNSGFTSNFGGSGNNLSICINTAEVIRYGAGGTNAFPTTDNVFDWGISTDRWKNIWFGTSISSTNLLFSGTAPTIAAAGCGGAAASIVTPNGTAAFDINVGTTPAAGGCTVTMPAATNVWNCQVNDFTTISTAVFVQKQTASTTTSVTFQNFSDVAVATAPTASDIYHVTCGAH